MININIYQDRPSTSLNISHLVNYFESLNFNVSIRESISELMNEIPQSEFSNYLDSIKIRNIESPLDKRTVPGEVVNSNVDPANVRENFYDGYWLQRKLHSGLSEKYPDDLSNDVLNIVITGRLFGTFGTRRYHARVLLTGEPCLLSTSGIVEAPARPKEYYFAKAKLLAEGITLNELDKLFEGRFIEYDSPKITDITCSYILQLIRYRYTGEPFCKSDKCCLYNSHWQEEVLELQYNIKVCDECSDILKI